MSSTRVVLSLALLAGGALAQPNYENILKNLKFRGIGPATMGGRIDDFAVVESDPRIIYVGAAGGGLFKTVNGGMTSVSYTHLDVYKRQSYFCPTLLNSAISASSARF